MDEQLIDALVAGRLEQPPCGAPPRARTRCYTPLRRNTPLWHPPPHNKGPPASARSPCAGGADRLGGQMPPATPSSTLGAAGGFVLPCEDRAKELGGYYIW